jgi:hypothetical protein
MSQEQDRSSEQESGSEPTDQPAVALPDGELTPSETMEMLQAAGVKDPVVVEYVMAKMSRSKSPFCSPDMLRAYDEYKTGFGAEVVEYIKSFTTHSRKLESRAQIFALAVALVGLLAAGTFSLLGANMWVCVIIAIVSVGGPGVATVLARYLDRIAK